jgi:hypothetical protein
MNNPLLPRILPLLLLLLLAGASIRIARAQSIVLDGTRTLQPDPALDAWQVVRRANPELSTEPIALRAEIAPPAPLQGSPLRLTARLPVGLDFEAHATADRWILGPEEDPVLLNEPTATFSTVDADATVRASLVLPRFLGGDLAPRLEISSQLRRSNFSPTHIEDLPSLKVGPGRLEVTGFSLSHDNLKLNGSFKLGNRTFAGAQLLWTPRGGFHLEAGADTGWLAPVVPGAKGNRKILDDVLFSMRTEFKLNLEVAPSAFALSVKGTFALHPGFRDSCPRDIDDAHMKLKFNLAISTDGRLPIDLPYSGHNRFLPDLW